MRRCTPESYSAFFLLTIDNSQLTMKPSSLTPTGIPHDRGFRVQTHETAPGVYSEEPKPYTRDQLQIIGYIN